MPVIGTDAAYGHAGIDRAVVLQAQVGKQCYEVVNTLNPECIELVANDGVDCDRYILHRLGAFLRCDNNFFEPATTLRVHRRRYQGHQEQRYNH